MNRTDASAGQHGVGGFGNHRKINGDAIAFAYTVLLQHIGEAADAAIKLIVGDVPVVIGIIALPDQGRLIATLFQMPVDAIVGDVQDAVLKPLNGYVRIGEARILYLFGEFDPVDALGVFRPKIGGLVHRFGIHRAIGCVGDGGALFPLGRNGV